MNEETQEHEPSRRPGIMNRRTVSFIAGAIVLVIIIIFLLYPAPVEEPKEAVPAKPEPAEPAEPVEPPTTEEERGDTAREIIQGLQSKDPVDYEEAYSRARAFYEEGRLADAQILYLFAAQGGHTQSAFALAGMYDPLHHSPETSLMDDPDPLQAYKWYKQAREQGHNESGARLAELHAWVEKAADEGDPEAERLLMIWE